MEDKITLRILEGWNEVSIETFQELSSLNTDSKGLTKVVDLISILTDTDIEDIKKIDASQLQLLVDSISWTSQFPTSEHKTEVVVNGDTYHLIRFSDLTLGEWIDLEAYTEDSISNMHRIFALFYRPTDEKYDTKLNEDRAEIFKKHLMIDDVYGSILFFYHIGRRYTLTLEAYLRSQTTMN